MTISGNRERTKYEEAWLNWIRHPPRKRTASDKGVCEFESHRFRQKGEYEESKESQESEVERGGTDGRRPEVQAQDRDEMVGSAVFQVWRMVLLLRFRFQSSTTGSAFGC